MKTYHRIRNICSKFWWIFNDFLGDAVPVFLILMAAMLFHVNTELSDDTERSGLWWIIQAFWLILVIFALNIARRVERVRAEEKYAEKVIGLINDLMTKDETIINVHVTDDRIRTSWEKNNE